VDEGRNPRIHRRDACRSASRRRLNVIFEIRTEDPSGHVLATASSLKAAVALLDEIEAVTVGQLRRNGEGTSDFWLRLAIHNDIVDDVDQIIRAGLAMVAGRR
jgi:hypothetical protein